MFWLNKKRDEVSLSMQLIMNLCKHENVLFWKSTLAVVQFLIYSVEYFNYNSINVFFNLRHFAHSCPNIIAKNIEAVDQKSWIVFFLAIEINTYQVNQFLIKQWFEKIKRNITVHSTYVWWNIKILFVKMKKTSLDLIFHQLWAVQRSLYDEYIRYADEKEKTHSQKKIFCFGIGYVIYIGENKRR